jgi:putative tryptophan/tyrosine transport system substrate-binding protein
VELTVVEFTGPSYDLRAAFEIGIRAGVDGFLPFSSAGFQLRRAELSELILQYRVPTIGPGTMAGDPGILVSYHPDIPRQVRRAAEIAVRILKGAKPADIPVEQPDAYELQVNLELAKRLGLKIPYSVMARATKVIE